VAAAVLGCYTSAVKPPMWRNGRRNGLKIAVFAIFCFSNPIKSSRIYLGKSSKFVDLAADQRGEQKEAHSCTKLAQPTQRISGPR
jgi:hypothetical protein